MDNYGEDVLWSTVAGLVRVQVVKQTWREAGGREHKGSTTRYATVFIQGPTSPERIEPHDVALLAGALKLAQSTADAYNERHAEGRK